MGLVDYSDSESESETAAKPSPVPTIAPAYTKKPSQKVVDRSNPRKILVNLGGSLATQDAKPTENEQPPAKRARTGRGAFSGFNSFLPPPKNTGKPALSSSSGKNAPRPGVNLKTGAKPGFSRNHEDGPGRSTGESSTNGGGMQLPTPKAQQPTIPEGQKPADEVKLVGKPLMFKPLSVSGKPKKSVTKSIAKVASAPAPASRASPQIQPEPEPEQAPKKKISLFSISDEPSEDVESTAKTNVSSNGSYEPMFPTEDPAATSESFAEYDAQFATSHAQNPSSFGNFESLDSIAADMNLSAEARRELFGRRGAPAQQTASKVINFNTDQEYLHNEELRASGEQQIYNPVRSIAPGKHNLRQLVNQVHNQRDALEDSFAQGKNNRNEAGAKYGWR